MRILIAGAGVIGTVYGAHLADAGHEVSVLSHPGRPGGAARTSLIARDLISGGRAEATVRTAASAADGSFDLVLVCVRGDQLAAACAQLTDLAGTPAVVFFGNNPGGRAAVTGQLPGQSWLGFPGIGGVLRDGIAEYVQIKQQPTALQAGTDARIDELAGTLRGRGFAVQRVADMDGWLVYHAAFVSCVAAALYACGTDPARLAASRRVLGLMCAAVTEAFTALRQSGVTGLPRNLAVLHSRLLRPVAIRYWAKVMRSPMGELCFAAHSRHAETEMRALGGQISARLAAVPGTSQLHRLLDRGQLPDQGLSARPPRADRP